MSTAPTTWRHRTVLLHEAVQALWDDAGPVERQLVERVGDAGRRLHTGRSRNEQVSLDLRLYLMRRIPKLERAVAVRKRAGEDVRRAEEEARRTELDVGKADAGIKRAEAAHAETRMTYDRLAAVSKSQPGLVAQQEIDVAQARERTTSAQVEEARAAQASARAAVAAAMVRLAVGTETDGSIICPSSMNGIVGLKPTMGLVPRTRVVPISHSQDIAGPMGDNVRDVEIGRAHV